MRYYGGELDGRGRDRAEGAEAGEGECGITVGSWMVRGGTAQRAQRQERGNAVLRWGAGWSGERPRRGRRGRGRDVAIKGLICSW